MKKFPIDEIWYCGVNPQGWPRWEYLDGRRKEVAKLLTSGVGADWKAKGWRIAKLRVIEEAAWR